MHTMQRALVTLPDGRQVHVTVRHHHRTPPQQPWALPGRVPVVWAPPGRVPVMWAPPGRVPVMCMPPAPRLLPPGATVRPGPVSRAPSRPLLTPMSVIRSAWCAPAAITVAAISAVGVVGTALTGPAIGESPTKVIFLTLSLWLMIMAVIVAVISVLINHKDPQHRPDTLDRAAGHGGTRHGDGTPAPGPLTGRAPGAAGRSGDPGTSTLCSPGAAAPRKVIGSGSAGAAAGLCRPVSSRNVNVPSQHERTFLPSFWG